MRRYGLAIGLAAAMAWFTGPPSARAAPAPDVLMQAINYVFTGRINPTDGPRIERRNGCVVLVPDPRNKRTIRYYLGRFNFDTARVEKTYSGRIESYTLAVESIETVVEFLNPDMSVAHGHTSARIPLPGEFDLSQRAVRLISDRCKVEEEKPGF